MPSRLRPDRKPFWRRLSNNFKSTAFPNRATNLELNAPNSALSDQHEFDRLNGLDAAFSGYAPI